MNVHFVDMFGCDGPEAAALMDLCWSNALFDWARQMLGDLFPRRRFETKFGLTVGSPRAGKGGTYFMGRRDLQAGLERRDRMLAKGQLAIYSVQYWDEPFSVTVGVDFARATLSPRLHCNVHVSDERAVEHQAALTDAAFDVFRQGLEAATARDGVVTTGPYRSKVRLGLLLRSDAVTRLGGRDAVAANAPAVSVVDLDGQASGGMIVRFAATPRTATSGGQRPSLEFLNPLIREGWELP